MRTLYIEGLATHDDPESCVGGRKGAGEALTGVHAGQAIEPRNCLVRGADAVTKSGRRDCWWRYREPSVDPARSKTLCMRGVSMRENREIPGSPVRPITVTAAQGRLRPDA